MAADIEDDETDGMEDMASGLSFNMDTILGHGTARCNDRPRVGDG
jgi:hypothetical protein